jgi:hypothetical protein
LNTSHPQLGPGTPGMVADRSWPAHGLIGSDPAALFVLQRLTAMVNPPPWRPMAPHTTNPSKKGVGCCYNTSGLTYILFTVRRIGCSMTANRLLAAPDAQDQAARRPATTDMTVHIDLAAGERATADPLVASGWTQGCST